jgi:hypothetical protein
LDSGAVINKDALGGTPLHDAAQNGQLEVDIDINQHIITCLAFLPTCLPAFLSICLSTYDLREPGILQLYSYT